MTQRAIRVGLIGVSPNRGWARDAHVPALKAVPGIELAAIANRSLESARKAADAFGAPAAYGNLNEMLASDIDLAVVTVRVPEHLKLVTAVLDAGKMVWCEWPLGRTLEEAVAMAEHARQVGVKNIVGLQMRCSPTIRYMADLIAAGFIGEVLSATLVGSGALWDAVMDEDYEYATSRSNGATLLSITCAHTIDGLCALLGEFASVQALEAQRRTTTTIRQTGRVIPVDAPDQVLFAGLLEAGVPVSVHYRGGIRGGTKLFIEINGTKGTLRVTGDSGGGQTANLVLEGCGADSTAFAPMPTPDRYRTFPELPGRVAPLANAYARLVDDLRDGTNHSADFEHGVRRHRLLDAIEESSRTGCRVQL